MSNSIQILLTFRAIILVWIFINTPFSRVTTFDIDLQLIKNLPWENKAINSWTFSCNHFSQLSILRKGRIDELKAPST